MYPPPPLSLLLKSFLIFFLFPSLLLFPPLSFTLRTLAQMTTKPAWRTQHYAHMKNITSSLPLYHNFIPKLNPLLKRNGLVNQVELLRQCHLAMFKTLYAKPTQKRYGYSCRDKICYKGSATYYWFHNLIGAYHSWGISPRNLTSIHQTVSCREARKGWARD